MLEQVSCRFTTIILIYEKSRRTRIEFFLNEVATMGNQNPKRTYILNKKCVLGRKTCQDCGKTVIPAGITVPSRIIDIVPSLQLYH